MKEHIALLRGINVGGRNKLPMKELQAILEGVGLTGVQTYIQSGNVVFDGNIGRDAAQKIGDAIESSKGFRPYILIMSRESLLTATSHNPFPTDDGKALHFFFLTSNPEKPDLEKLTNLASDSEAFLLGENVFYLYAPEGIGRSKLASSIERALGVEATARNWNTVEKLIEMAQD